MFKFELFIFLILSKNYSVSSIFKKRQLLLTVKVWFLTLKCKQITKLSTLDALKHLNKAKNKVQNKNKIFTKTCYIFMCIFQNRLVLHLKNKVTARVRQITCENVKF